MKPEWEEEVAARVSALWKQGAAPAHCLSAAEECNRLVLGGASLALADSAIELLRDCRSRMPADSAEQPALLAAQANSWRVRYLRTGDEADLRQAVAAVDDAYALAGPAHPLHAGIRHSRATVYELIGGPDRIGSRHRITSEDGDADPAFQIRALLCTITELLVRHNKTQDTTALDEALTLAERALNSACGNDGERWWLLMRAAQPYAIKATRTHDVGLVTKAIELLREALSLLPAGDAHTAGLNNELGACLHIRAKIQHDLDELAAALRLLRDSVERTPSTSVDYASFSSNLVMALRTLWKRERDPAILDLERYLLPSPLADLRARLGPNPLVVINVSRYRCDALIVTGVREVSVVPLPALTADDAAKHAARFPAALNRLRINRGPHDRGPRPKERKQLIATMRDTLAWLWEAVAEPVLAALGITPPVDGIPPQVRWSPTAGPWSLMTHRSCPD